MVTGQVSGSGRRVGFMIEQLFARVSGNDVHLYLRDDVGARLAKLSVAARSVIAGSRCQQS
jgi:hypothetical protein